MNHQAPQKSPVRRRGIALVIVVSVLALATILVLAMFSVTESEFKSTQSYAAGQSARHFADSAVSIVINQIQAGSRQSASTPGREFHATQPGAIRKFNENGAFVSGHKLYSDERMTETTPALAGETLLTQDVPPQTWDQPENLGRYVDLNEPAITTGVGGAVRLAFPIVDPRAFEPDPLSPGNPMVEGFAYYQNFKSKAAATLNGVVLPAGGNSNDLRLPMPVEWIYVLKDGTLGTLDADRNFISVGQPPTVQNPIVGRFAFWTDDESCKVNINTASEPTFWAPPITYHERAHLWAERPPTINEYQRFPGHPATVALSSVLFPNQDLDQYGKPQATVTKIVEMKEAIYRIIPKINMGGSIAGTVPYLPDDLDRAQAEKVGIGESIKERLYATLDELLFSEQLNGTVRGRNDLLVDGTPLITPEVLERRRFFLTANSRSPEFSMLGVPRVAIWPVADESLGQDHRTIYDKLIAFCATLDAQRDSNAPQTAKTYYFRRKDAHSASTDVNLNRNQELLDYLRALMNSTYPRGSAQSGGNFATKYGDKDARQIIISIFDYIRATNLYDGYLAPKFADLINMNGKTVLEVYLKKDAIAPQNNPTANQFKTYTEPRYITRRTDDNRGHSGEIPDTDVANGAFPGHGQVTPSHWRVGSDTYMGYGRSVTITEAALHFICTADGKKDDKSFKIWNKVGASYVKSSDPADQSGGRTGPRIDPGPANVWKHTKWKYGPDDVPEEDQFWYSNYPPFPSPGKYGTSATAGEDSPRHAMYHPGYDPENWNVTLDRDVPLADNEKRIQAALQIELFCPMAGWTKIVPELTFVADGRAVSAITLNDKSLFSTTDNLVVKTEGSVFEGWGANPMGATASFRNFVDGRRTRGIRDMGNDPSYNSAAGGGEHADMLNLDFISSFVTIDRTQPMQFKVPEPIRIDIYDDHDWQGKEPMQTVMLNFPAGPNIVMSPDLIVTSTEHRIIVAADGSISDQRAVESPRWWTFNWAGCVRRFEGSASRYLEDPNSITPRLDFNGANVRTCGRLRQDGGTGVVSANYGGYAAGLSLPATQQFIYGAGGFSGVKNKFDERDNPLVHHGTDVVRSILPKYGDYRITAARRFIPGAMWTKHPLWDHQDVPMAHSLTSFSSAQESGFDRSGQKGVADDPMRRLVPIPVAQGIYNAEKIPDMPHTTEAVAAAARFRDFDNAVGPARDGAYLNKPDEGNFSALHFWIANGVRLMRNAYYFDSWMSQSGDEAFFTPNRMMASAVTFGSIPTGVWGGAPPSAQTDAASQGVPWRTLLFRPDVKYPSGGLTHTGVSVQPRDHYLLDLFYMPVVEPYAISEPLSVAGRINMNYQMLPFTHIRRATGLYAVMKGEIFNAVPKKDVGQYLYMNNTGTWPQLWWQENRQDSSVPVAQVKYWQRKINIPETLKQIDDRFNFSGNMPSDSRGLFRSASQICEVHLIPTNIPLTYPNANVNTGVTELETDRKDEMGRFWDAHALTGDNSRERPYSNLYPRLTSRSNTFRVHIRAQAIRKARSTDPAIVVPATDAVLSEYRGSTLIERYIDPNDPRIPEYADGSNPLSKESLDTFYRFRVLETKRFVP